jgi:hypothetical protein
VTVVRQRRRGIAPAVVPTEHAEQSLLVKWAALQLERHPELAYLVAVPNFFGNVGNVHARMGAAMRAKAEGRKKGYPDLILDVARGGFHGLRIEMKKVKGGSVDPEQRAWHEWLRSQGYRVEVCKGWEAARDVLLDYLQTA